MSIDQKQLERLIGIAGMLGSDHEGERANAARFATTLLRQFGLTWRELFQRAFLPQAERRSTGKQHFWDVREAGRQAPPGMNPFQNMGAGMGQPPPYQHAYGAQFRQGWQETPPKSRTNEHTDPITGEVTKLWDVITRAARNDYLWNNWERAFISTFVHHGPRCQATPAQWTYVLKLKRKMDRETV